MISPSSSPEQAARIAVRRDEDGLGLEQRPDPRRGRARGSRRPPPPPRARAAARAAPAAGPHRPGWKSAPGKRPARGSGSSSRHSAAKPSSRSASYSARSSSRSSSPAEPEAARAPDRVAAELDHPVDVAPRSGASSRQRRRGRATSRALSYAIAPPRRANPPLRPLAPEATARASCSRTRLPRRASVSAAGACR